MNTYKKFLVTNFLSSLLNVFLIVFCLIFILNLLTELDFFKEIEVAPHYPIYLSLLNTPSFIFEMFPFIFLISTQLFFNNMFNDNQLNIFKYSGLKNLKIINIINITAFIVGIVLITLFYNFASNLKNFYIETKSNYTSDNKYLAVITNNGLWIKDINNENTLIINAAKIDQNFLLDSYISVFDQNFEIKKNIKSKKIDVSKKDWLIYDAEVFTKNSKETKKKIKLSTSFNYEIIQSLFSNLSSLSFLELLEMRKNYKKLNYSLTEVDLQLLKLVLFPFYLVLMTLISSIIMMNTKKLKNKYIKITIGLFFSVVVYYVSNFFYVLGETERINLVLSSIIPLMFLLSINIFFIRDINAK
jgi:lipopolysaccharide export system permease protein